MKINLLKTEDNHLKGWDIIPENDDEKKILGSLRNAIFWGFDKTEPKYAGMEDEIKEDKNGKEHRYVTKLMWRIPKYTQEEIPE